MGQCGSCNEREGNSKVDLVTLALLGSIHEGMSMSLHKLLLSKSFILDSRCYCLNSFPVRSRDLGHRWPKWKICNVREWATPGSAIKGAHLCTRLQECPGCFHMFSHAFARRQTAPFDGGPRYFVTYGPFSYFVSSVWRKLESCYSLVLSYR